MYWLPAASRTILRRFASPQTNIGNIGAGILDYPQVAVAVEDSIKRMTEVGKYHNARDPWKEYVVLYWQF